MKNLFLDLGFGLRMLKRQPSFTLAVTATLALGIAGPVAVFSLVDALYLKSPAGVMDPDRLARIYVQRDAGNVQSPDGSVGTYPDFRTLREGAEGFADVATMMFPRQLDLDRGESARRVRGEIVSASYFSVLGLQPEHGRFFRPEEDDAAGAHPVAVISHGFWQRYFGADPEALDRLLGINQRELQVVGVAPEGFSGLGAEPIDVWVPLAMAEALGLASAGDTDWRDHTGMLMLRLVGRLAPGFTRDAAAETATAALTAVAANNPELDPTPVAVVAPLQEARGPARKGSADVVLWLMVVTVLVLLIACANVANLQLGRGVTRQREIALRMSLGASRGRIARQMLTESLLLSLLGGGAAFLLAGWSLRLAGGLPLVLGAVDIDPRAAWLALGLTVLTAALFGVAPALQAMRSQPLRELGEGGATTDRRLRRSGRGLVAGQVALSLVLLLGAGLFLRSVQKLHAIDPGIDFARLLAISVDLDSAGYQDATRQHLEEQAAERLRRVPGVESVTTAWPTPFSGSASARSFDMPDEEDTFDEGPYFHWVGADYFRTVGLPIVEGRPILATDGEGTRPVAVINEPLARALAAASPEPVAGRCVAIGSQVKEGGCTEIVGVAANARYRYEQDKEIPQVFLPQAQHGVFRQPAFLVRVRGPVDRVLPTARAAVQGIAPDLPYVEAQSLTDILGHRLVSYRLGATLFTLFGALALVLAAVGLYGVLAYAVAQRTRELGVRRALGAQQTDLVRMVLTQGLRPVLAGLLIGGLLGLAGTRLIRARLFEVSPHDPVTFLVAVLTLVLVALVAIWLPARRAATIDPMVALRAE